MLVLPYIDINPPWVYMHFLVSMTQGWGSQLHKHQISMSPIYEKIRHTPELFLETKPVNPKGNQPWIFIGRTDAEAEAPILWPPDAKSWLFGKDPNAGKDWRQEEKWATEDEMVGWHHQLNRQEFEQAPATGDRQGSLVCWGAWGCKMSDTMEWLNSTDTEPEGDFILFFHTFQIIYEVFFKPSGHFKLRKDWTIWTPLKRSGIKRRLLFGRKADKSRHGIKKQVLLCLQRSIYSKLCFFQ